MTPNYWCGACKCWIQPSGVTFDLLHKIFRYNPDGVTINQITIHKVEVHNGPVNDEEYGKLSARKG